MPAMPTIGDKQTINPTFQGGSFLIVLTRPMLQYMGFSEEEIENAIAAGNDDGKERLAIVVKYDVGKWGTYCGIGKPGKH